MNQALLVELIEKALAGKITFPEILATHRKEAWSPLTSTS